MRNAVDVMMVSLEIQQIIIISCKINIDVAEVKIIRSSFVAISCIGVKFGCCRLGIRDLWLRSE